MGESGCTPKKKDGPMTLMRMVLSQKPGGPNIVIRKANIRYGSITSW